MAGGRTRFSQARARVHLTRLAGGPHPTGSPSNRWVRDYLATRLTDLGMTVTVRETVSVSTGADGAHRAGRVANVHAIPPGAADRPRVLLVAHYDSVAAGPGAADNAAGVATLLEVARVLLLHGSTGFEMLLTDGEEAGLLGAAAFLAAPHSADPHHTVVLNLDSRGNRGRPVVFECLPGPAGPPLSALHRIPATALSLSSAVYRRLPHDTDLTPFRHAGFPALNLGLISGSATYHTARDTPSEVSARSLTALGRSVLAICEELLAAQTPSMAACHPGEETRARRTAGGRHLSYFGVFGQLAHYPAMVDTALATSAALVTNAVAQGTERGRVRGWQVSGAAAAWAAGGAAAIGVGGGGWRVLKRLRPDYAGFAFGDPYRPGAAVAGEAAAVTALAIGEAVAASRWCGRAERGTAFQGAVSLAGIAAGTALPGAGYLFAWPAASGASALVMGARPGGPAHAAALATPLAALALPAARALFPALGLKRSGLPLALVHLTATACLLPFGGHSRRWLGRTASALLAAGAASMAVGVMRGRPSPRFPAQVPFTYLRDTDSGDAWWAGPGLRSSGGLADRFPALPNGARLRWRSAPLLPAPEPEVTVLSVPSAAEVSLRIRAAGAHLVSVHVEEDIPDIVSARVDGVELPSHPVGHPWQMRFIGPPHEGVTLTLRLRTPAALRLAVTAHSRLPEPAPRTRPATWSAARGGEALVTRRFRLP